MISNNIAQIAYLNARICGTKRIYFAGTFLRRNPSSMRTLSYAINFWSGAKMSAYFLRHEGYCGAVGALVKGRHVAV